MSKINEQAIKELTEKFKIEMNSRQVDWRFIGMSGVARMIWWAYFAQYRVVFFMQRCCDGMAHQVAWSYAKTQSKKEILKTLEACGWKFR